MLVTGYGIYSRSRPENRFHNCNLVATSLILDVRKAVRQLEGPNNIFQCKILSPRKISWEGLQISVDDGTHSDFGVAKRLARDAPISPLILTSI